MEKNKTALEVNTSSDTSINAENETDHVMDSKLSDKDKNNLKDSIKGLDKTEEANRADNKGNVYMTDTEEDNKNTVKDSLKDNNSNSVIDDSDNDNTQKPERELTNIEKYRQSVTKDVVRQNCSKGGRNSAENRRQRKTLGETLTAILETGNNQEDLCLALFQSALKGNYKAFNSLRDTIGEMPTQKQEVTTNMTEGDRELLENVQKRLKEQNITK